MTTAIVLTILGLKALPNGTTQNQEFGKWLLTLAAGVVTAGVIVAAFRVLDRRHTERTEWRTRLADLTSAHDLVQTARLRLAAHQTAKSYSDEISNLVTARETLRRAFAEGEVDDVTRKVASQMWKYLERLGEEYKRGYLRISRQQRLDEARLKKWTDAWTSDGTNPPEEFYGPLTAFQELLDEPLDQHMDQSASEGRRGFPELRMFLDPAQFESGDFKTGYRDLRKMIRGRLGLTLAD